eukprot:4084015-Amphidinium_carterae.1
MCAASRSTFTTRLTRGVRNNILSEPGELGGSGWGVNAGGEGKLSLAPCTRLPLISSSSRIGSPFGASALQSLRLAGLTPGLTPLPLAWPGVNGVGVNGAALTGGLDT